MRVFAVGDIHAKNVVPSIRRKFEEFLRTDSETYIIFLGDYIDRGNYSLKVIIDLLCFAYSYPGRVFFLVGNHEGLFMEDFSRNTFMLDSSFCNHGKNSTISSMGGIMPVPVNNATVSVDSLGDMFLKNLNYFFALCNLMYGKIEIIIGNHMYRFTHAGPKAKTNQGCEFNMPRTWARIKNISLYPGYYDRKKVKYSSYIPEVPHEAGYEYYSGRKRKYITNVFGHTPIREKGSRAKMAFIGQRLAENRLIGIDCSQIDPTDDKIVPLVEIINTSQELARQRVFLFKDVAPNEKEGCYYLAEYFSSKVIVGNMNPTLIQECYNRTITASLDGRDVPHLGSFLPSSFPDFIREIMREFPQHRPVLQLIDPEPPLPDTNTQLPLPLSIPSEADSTSFEDDFESLEDLTEEERAEAYLMGYDGIRPVQDEVRPVPPFVQDEVWGRPPRR